MTIPTFTSPAVKIAVVILCLGAVALMKYGLKWSDDNIIEKVAEDIIEKEVGVQIPLPDLPTDATTTPVAPAAPAAPAAPTSTTNTPS